MTGQAITHCREASKKCEKSSGKNHLVLLVVHLIRESHRDEGDATDEVADVKEEEASEEGEGGPEQPGRLLAGPQTPQGGGEVSHCIHPHHLLLTGRRRARWPPHRQLSQAAVLLRPAAA